MQYNIEYLVCCAGDLFQKAMTGSAGDTLPNNGIYWYHILWYGTNNLVLQTYQTNGQKMAIIGMFTLCTQGH